MAIVRQYAYIT